MVSPRFVFLLILFPALVRADGANASFRCRWALSDDRGQMVLNEADQRSNGRLLEGHRLSSMKRSEALDVYLSQIPICNLAVQLQSDRLTSEILTIIYGDKLSIIKKWTSARGQYKSEKHQQLIREFLLRKGLVEIFREIGHDSPTFLTRLKIRLRSILKNSGLLWVIARRRRGALLRVRRTLGGVTPL